MCEAVSRLVLVRARGCRYRDIFIWQCGNSIWPLLPENLEETAEEVSVFKKGFRRDLCCEKSCAWREKLKR